MRTIILSILQTHALAALQYQNLKFKMFQSDGGLKFDNNILDAHFQKHGIYFRKPCPATEGQNGPAS